MGTSCEEYPFHLSEGVKLILGNFIENQIHIPDDMEFYVHQFSCYSVTLAVNHGSFCLCKTNLQDDMIIWFKIWSKSIVSAFLSLITQRAHRVASHVHQLEILICSIYEALIITTVNKLGPIQVYQQIMQITYRKPI